MIVQQVVNGRPATITYFRSDWTPVDEQDANWARVSYDDDGSAGVFAIEHPPTLVDKVWDPSKHPRVPSGSTGGQFVGTGSAGEAVLSAVEAELGAASVAQVAPADFTRNTPPAEPGYAYHATNSYNLADIQDAGKLQTFKPSHGTDQDVWPDGSTQKRSYWTANPETGKSFYPEGGTPTLLRTNLAASQIKRESGTPDLYAAKPIPAERLEYWAEDSQWHPVASAHVTKAGFDESKHPRVPAGSSAGGQFGSASGALGRTMEDIVGGDIRPPKEDIYEVADATSNAMRVVGNATANVDNLAGGVALADPEQRVRIDRLKHAITGAGGYFERVIVDQNGGVVEGQHRLDAARELGVKSIPVVLVNDLDHNGALARLETAVKATGQIRTENARQIARQVLDMAAEVGPDKIEAEFDMPKGYEPAFKAAIAALKPDDVITDVEAIARLAGIPSNIQKLNNASSRSLYVHRGLLNPDDVRAWAKEQGFTSTLEPADMHVTVAFSKEPVDWSTFEPDESDLIVPATTDAAARSIRALGPEGKAIVLSFASPDLEERWLEFCDGCSWDYPDYKPHVTLTYSGTPLDLRSIRPYMGELRFGPERFDPINENRASGIKESVTKALSQLFAGLTGILKGDPGAGDMHVDQPMGSDKPRRRRKPAVMDDEDEPMMQAQMIAKSDDESRLVFGWGSVISKNGEPVVDTQEDVITPAELLKSTTEFMENVRYAAEMHPRDENQNFTPDMAKGQVVHSFPLTADIAKALGIQTDREGWIIGVKVHDDDVWKRVKDGTLKGFSIGASALRVPL